MAAACLAALLALPATGASGAEGAYRVGAGDTLQITTYGDAGLTGPFVVQPDGSIGFPLIGSVAVAGKSPPEIEALINKAIGRYVAGRTATVAVAAYAPVYILGDVERPGRYDFHPGMIALELVAVSGGERRGRNTVESAQIQIVAARQEYADLALQVFSNQVRRARFQAELDGTGFSYPLGEGLDPAEIRVRQGIVDQEAKLFGIRRDNLAAQQAALASQAATYKQEFDTLSEREALHGGELKLLEQDVASTKSLVERGLTAQSTLRDVQRQLSAARRDALEMGSYIARAKQGELDIEQRKAALVEAVRVEAAGGLRELDLDTVRKQKQMSALLERMAAISSASEALKAREVHARLGFVVVRGTGSGTEEIRVDEMTEIRPRDILRATLEVPGLDAVGGDQPAPAAGTREEKVGLAGSAIAHGIHPHP